MNNHKTNLHAVVYICAFVIGVILLWSIGKAWLDFESKSVVMAGVVGVAISVIIFRVWNMIRQSKNHSGKKDN